MLHTPLNFDGAKFEILAKHVDGLLDETSGCPWDKKQEVSDLIPMLVDEVREFTEAWESGDPDRILDEAGDIYLLMFLILSKVKAKYSVDINAVATKSVEKIVRRHTWIYGDDVGKVKTPEDAERIWAENKKKEQ